MPKALVQGRIAVQFTDLLRKNLDNKWSILVWDPKINTPEDFIPMAREADVIIGGGIPLAHWPETPNLKMFQIPWAGYDFCSPETMPARIPVCNCFEHESTIAEYVIGAMLEWTIGLREMDRRFRSQGWAGRLPGEFIVHKEIRGRTLGIVGYGHIGAEVAVRAAAFGMRIIGTRRTPQTEFAPLEWLGTVDKLHDLLSESDFILIACDLNSETEGLIGSAELAAIGPNAVIINVSRGRVVQEQPLFNALKAKTIGGAVLDVWYNHLSAENPDIWPSNFPFQELDNVILTGHESAASQEQIERRWQFVAANIERAVQNQTLENFVFEGIQGKIRY